MSSHTIGVATLIRNRGKLLVGKRGKACLRGTGCLAFPGGIIQEGETIINGAIREVKEETGLDVLPVTNSAFFNPGDAHLQNLFSVPGLLAATDHSDISQQRDGHLIDHLTLWIMLRYVDGEPVVKEPTKCDWWDWLSPQTLTKLEGSSNPTHSQYFWTPAPLLRNILRPYFGSF